MRNGITGWNFRRSCQEKRPSRLCALDGLSAQRFGHLSSDPEQAVPEAFNESFDKRLAAPMLSDEHRLAAQSLREQIEQHLKRFAKGG